MDPAVATELRAVPMTALLAQVLIAKGHSYGNILACHQSTDASTGNRRADNPWPRPGRIG